MITTDSSGTVTFLNPAAEAMTGWKLAEAQGAALERVFRIINEDTREPVVNPVQKVLDTGIAVGLANHTALIARNGDVIAIEDSAAPIRDAAGHVVGAVMVFHDVTDRRHAERALRASDERLRAMFSQAAVGIASSSLESHFLEANQKFCDILGYTLEELRQLTFIELTHPEDVAKTTQDMARLLAGDIPHYVLEKRYVRKDGEIVWSRTTVTLLREVTGEPSSSSASSRTSPIANARSKRCANKPACSSCSNETGTAIAAQLDLQTLVQRSPTRRRSSAAPSSARSSTTSTNEHGESFLLYTLSGAPREAFEKFGLPRNTPVFDPTFRGEGVVRSADITKDPRYGTMAPHHGMPQGPSAGAQLPRGAGHLALRRSDRRPVLRPSRTRTCSPSARSG